METKLKKSLLNKCNTPEEEAILRQSFVSGHDFRVILISVLDDKLDAVHKSQILDREYSNEWAYKQAADNGYQRGIKEILSLLQ